MNETPAHETSVASRRSPGRAKRLAAAALVGVLVVAVLVFALGALLGKPAGLPTGLTLAAFQQQVARDLAKPGSLGGFAVSGVASVSCVPPDSWTPGKSFTCFAYRKDDVELGTVSGVVRPTLAGGAWSANLTWNAGT